MMLKILAARETAFQKYSDTIGATSDKNNSDDDPRFITHRALSLADIHFYIISFCILFFLYSFLLYYLFFFLLYFSYFVTLFYFFFLLFFFFFS